MVFAHRASRSKIEEDFNNAAPTAESRHSRAADQGLMDVGLTDEQTPIRHRWNVHAQQLEPLRTIPRSRDSLKSSVSKTLSDNRDASEMPAISAF